jgi:hypothetical protein
VNATLHTKRDVVTIAGLPRVDRYFPDCWCAVIEAVSRYHFGIDDFGKVYGRHGFHYQRPRANLGYRDNGVELDLEFSRSPVTTEELESSIESLYGIRTDMLTFDRLGALLDYCERSIAEGCPVVLDYDLGFIKQRREYQKVHGVHIVALYELALEERRMLAAEQMLGSIAIDFDDFESCFARRLALHGGMHVWRVSRSRSAERELERDEVRAQVLENVVNLTSTNRAFGLTALSAFRADLRAFLGSAEFQGRPFAIPGLWVFSHERHIERKWLAAVRRTCPGDGAFFDEFDALLSNLFKGWLGTDYLLEKALLSGNGRGLRALTTFLDELAEAEARASEKWIELGRMLDQR